MSNRRKPCAAGVSLIVRGLFVVSILSTIPDCGFKSRKIGGILKKVWATSAFNADGPFRNLSEAEIGDLVLRLL
jgi:hypothetical protein